MTEAEAEAGTETPTPRRPGGRRAAPRARRRVGASLVLAVLVPLAVGAAAVGLAPTPAEPPPAVAPDRAPLAEQTLVCPPPAGDPAPVVVGRAPDAGGGPVEVTEPGAGPGAGAGDTAGEEVDPPAGGTADPVTIASRPAVVRALGDAAPGLLAARVAVDRTSATDCAPPAADQWFTGLGAGPERASVIELVNPGTGPAVADVVLLGADGPLDAPDVAGVTVPPGERLALDLAAIVPTAEDLAARVQVVRGRLGVTVVDRETPVGGEESVEWLSPQPAPATSSLLPGLVGGAGPRTLVVANPGSAETRVEVLLTTPTGPIAPVDVEPLRVPAGGVRTLDLGDVLGVQVDEGASGLLLRSEDPVVATLRSGVRGDLALGATVPALARAAGVVPDGDTARVVVAAGDGQGAVTGEVVARDADGVEVGTERLQVEPGGSVEVEFPAEAATVTVAAASGATLSSAVVVRRGDGTAVLGLREPVSESLVPAVRPGLP